ncbi:MAG TPA: hypothetical protein VKB46_10995 [Pyrinomonadaceae bacterium]|nr:hypothetical protein [Pyrinomonadaceae bacterium]
MIGSPRFFQSAYGLTFQSNVPIPGLLVAQPATSELVECVLGVDFPACEIKGEPWYVSDRDENGVPILTASESVDGQEFHFRYCDQTEFLVNRAGTRILARWTADQSLENTTTYLVGQISAFVLRLRGLVCLHGSSILIGKRAFTVVGDSGAGKSTTAAAFARLGHPVLTEDVSPVIEREQTFLIQTGYPRINLWDDVVESFYGSATALPRIVSNWDKKYLDLQREGVCFHKEAARLSAVYVLGERSDGEAAPRIEPLSATESLLALLTNAHGRYLLDKPMRAKEFELLSRLNERVVVKRVVPHAAIDRLDQLTELILRDFQTVPSEVR